MIYTDTCHRRTRGLGARAGSVGGRAQLFRSGKAGRGEAPRSTPQQPRQGQALGGGCPDPQALAFHPALKCATVGEQGPARIPWGQGPGLTLLVFPAPSMVLAPSRHPGDV